MLPRTVTEGNWVFDLNNLPWCQALLLLIIFKILYVKKSFIWLYNFPILQIQLIAFAYL